MPEFRGGVFCDELDGGRAGAQIEVETGRVRAQTRGGECFELATEACEVELGGASGRMWFVRSGDGALTFYSEAPGFGDALATVSVLAAKVHEIRERDRSKRSRHRALRVLGLVAVLLLLVGGLQGVKVAGRAALLALPTSIDDKVGKVAIETTELGGPVVDDPVVTASVEKLVGRLTEHAEGDFDYRIQVVDASTVNAFALPGGQIVIFTGLIREAESIDAVAGVLAHEIAHVTLRHGVQRIGQALGLAAAVQILLGDVGGVSALAIELVQQGALTSYGRDQERAADREGVRLMLESGLDPRGLIQIFERFAEEQDELPAATSWLSSHPDPRERIASIEALIADSSSGPSRALDLDFKELRERLGIGEQSSEEADGS